VQNSKLVKFFGNNANKILLPSTAVTLHVIVVYVLLFPLNIGVYPVP
jgi:hypothetical protein